VDIYVAGLGMGLSLIVAIGAQNVFVLRQGLRREHVGLVVAVCAVSDAILIAAGVAGLGALIDSAPWLIAVAKWAGAGFLVVYGALAARRAWRPKKTGLEADDATAAKVAVTTSTVTSVGLTALALTWLNPHVYLDTVFLLGTIAASQAQPWVFGVGAMTASVVWFTALGYGARRLAPLLSTPRAWRVLDAVIAVVMVALAVFLVLSV
jgi:L-lysine exporter family protein LysE/ArgO